MIGRTLLAKRFSSAVPTRCLISSSSGSSDCRGHHTEGLTMIMIMMIMMVMMITTTMTSYWVESYVNGQTRPFWKDQRLTMSPMVRPAASAAHKTHLGQKQPNGFSPGRNFTQVQ
jgi:hypothetical protein